MSEYFCVRNIFQTDNFHRGRDTFCPRSSSIKKQAAARILRVKILIDVKCSIEQKLAMLIDFTPILPSLYLPLIMGEKNATSP